LLSFEGELNESQKRDVEKMRENIRQQQHQVTDLRQQLDSQTALNDRQKARIEQLTEEARWFTCLVHLRLTIESFKLLSNGFILYTFWTWQRVPNGYQRCSSSSSWNRLLSDFRSTTTFPFLKRS